MADVTAHKQAEEALRDLEARHQIALEGAELATWDWDVAADRVVWNEQQYRRFGLEPGGQAEESQAFLRFVHPEDLGRVRGALERAVTGGVYRAAFRIVRADDGQVRWMNGFGRVVERQGGRATRLVGVMADVSGYSEPQEAFARDSNGPGWRVAARSETLPPGERRFEQAFRLGPVAACLTTFGRETLVEVNDAFLALTGYTRSQVVGRTSRELDLWPEVEDRQKLGEVQRRQSGFRELELKLRPRAGDDRVVLLSGEVVRLDGAYGYVKMLCDVTRSKQAEAQLHRAIDEVVGDMSWFSHKLTARLARIKPGSEVPASVALSPREQQVLARLAGGVSNEVIAGDLELSGQTVRNYVSSLYRKLAVHSRAEAVVWARDRGIGTG